MEKTYGQKLVDSLRMEAACAMGCREALGGKLWGDGMELLGKKLNAAADEIERLSAIQRWADAQPNLPQNLWSDNRSRAEGARQQAAYGAQLAQGYGPCDYPGCQLQLHHGGGHSFANQPLSN